MNIRIGIVTGLLFTTLFFYPVILHVTKPLATRDDVAYGYFLMEHNLRTLASGDLGHLFDTRMFFPLETTLALGNSMLGQALLGLPLYIVTKHVVTTTNVNMLMNYFLSYLFVYLLAYRVSRSVKGSVFAGVIYAFNPYMMSRLHPELTVFEWIPLLLLAADRLCTRITWRQTLLCSCAFCMLLLSSFYYVFFAILAVGLYLLVRMVQDRISVRHFVQPVVMIGLFCTIGFCLWYLLPFMQQKTTYHVVRSFEGIAEYSARVPDFFFTSAENKLYGRFSTQQLARSLYAGYARVDPFEHPYEHRLFLGTVATLFVLCFSWFLLRKRLSREKIKGVVPYLVVWVFSGILMFGPGWGLYRVIYALPFADALRAPSRFIVLVILCVSVCSATTWSVLETSMQKRWAMILFFLGIVVMGVEYQYNFGAFTDTAISVKTLYQQVERTGIRTILELPMTNGGTGSPFVARSDIEDATYLYNAVYHHMSLINGYSGFIPPVYQQLGSLVATEFPTDAKLEKLRAWGVDAIVLHVDEYAYPSYGDVTLQGLRARHLPEIASSGAIHVFSLQRLTK